MNVRRNWGRERKGGERDGRKDDDEAATTTATMAR